MSDHMATEDGIRKLAEKLAEAQYQEGDIKNVTCLEDLFERVLRESKLPQLIAAGQKMHQHAWGDHAEFAAAHKTFGLALAAFFAATEGK